MLSRWFSVPKPALAMVQLRPLPGSYRYAGEPLPSIVDAALAETAVLADAGFDGVQLQNMGDNPSTRHVGPETVAYMTAAALAIKQAYPALSLSILVNWDAEAAIAVADASGAHFVRIEHTFTGVAVTSWGFSEACCHQATRFQRRIGARAPIFADVYEPHAVPLAPLPIDVAAHAASSKVAPRACSSRGAISRSRCNGSPPSRIGCRTSRSSWAAEQPRTMLRRRSPSRTAWWSRRGSSTATCATPSIRCSRAGSWTPSRRRVTREKDRPHPIANRSRGLRRHRGPAGIPRGCRSQLPTPVFDNPSPRMF